MLDDNKPLDYAPADPGAARRRLTTQILLIGLCALLLSVTICGVVAGRRAVRSSSMISCAANLRNIGQAIQLYFQDNLTYPPDLRAVLLTQDIGADVFVCPASPDTRAQNATAFGSPGTCSYIYVGLSLAVAANPQYVVAVEDPANHDMEGGNVLFADGHVEWFAFTYLVEVLSDVQSGRNPPSTTTTLTPAQAAKLYDTQLKPLMPGLKSGAVRFPTTAPTTRP